MTNYDTLVLIGRFQPVHNAHAEIIAKAINMAKQVIVIVGSAKQPRTYKNPWTSHERVLMLNNVVDDMLPKLPTKTVRVEENVDTVYNDQSWAARIQAIVSKHTMPGDNIGIIGHTKDDTSYYLSMFPQWGFVEVNLIQPLNATNIRDLYFRKNANMNFIRGVVPPVVTRMLESWKDTPDYNQIIKEREFVDDYKKQYSSLPYAPVFVTVDAVVVCAGHVLMVKRRSEPGRGLWAMPGGFLNAATDRIIRDAMIRELREETMIKVPGPVLVGSITRSMVFDAIDRSARGRTITHCFKIDLPPGELPKVKGSDDAEKAQWIPIASINSSTCFEDHFEIITTMLG
jgi:bifunctional NMN adenylyltransferase/nudix hydrolase